MWFRNKLSSLAKVSLYKELLHLFLWDCVATLFPSGKVHAVWTEQGGSSHSSVAVCMSHVKNCWPSKEHLGSLCLTHSLVVELLEILRLQLVHACAHTHMHTGWTDPGQPCCTVKLYRVHKNDTLQWRTQEFFLGGGSTNSVEDRGQRWRDLGAVAP